MSTTTSALPSDAVAWKDAKRHRWLLGLSVPMLPFMGWAAVRLTGLGMFWWMGPLWIFVLIPILDAVQGTDASNPPESAVAALEADRYYRWCTFLFLPIQLVAFAWGAWMFVHGGLSLVDRLGLAVTVGAVGGIGIANAHELGHKREHVERWLAKIVLAQTAYGHFYVEHNRGHHVRVATPEDPTSSRLGETFWAFLPRTVIGSLRSGWDLEATRLRRQNRRVWSLRNDVLNAWVLTVVLFGAVVAWLGAGVVPMLAVQAVFGFSLLEVVNYVEHYGLLRQKDERGRYERCRPEHSWNSNHVASNVFLYHLERHSDHHANPLRRYQALRHFDEAPQLPSGYGLMIGLAYIPPVWRRLMDHRVVELYGGDVTKANIHPAKRDAILARYAAS